MLLQAINQNGLSVFLLVSEFVISVGSETDRKSQANVATGFVNLALPTMYVNDVPAMVILCVYSTGVCLFAWMTRERRLWKL